MASTIHMGVLVDEHQRVGHVRVAQVDDGGADPRAAHAPLREQQHVLHRTPHTGCLLDALQPLARVLQHVGLRTVEQVLIGEVPERCGGERDGVREKNRDQKKRSEEK